MSHKTHTMATRYGSHATEDIPSTQNSAPLDLVPPEHLMPEGDIESYDEYCEETDTFHPLAELLEQFQQCKHQFEILISTTPQYTPTAELMQFADKLQLLVMRLKLHSANQPSEEP